MGLAKLTDEVRFVLPADVMGYLIERVLGVGEAAGSLRDTASADPFTHRVTSGLLYGEGYVCGCPVYCRSHILERDRIEATSLDELECVRNQRTGDGSGLVDGHRPMDLAEQEE